MDLKTRLADKDAGWCGGLRRGANMGRNHYAADTFTGKLTLQRVRLNSGGYDAGGAYWGHGTPLYWYASECGSVDAFLRAGSRDEAKQAIREQYPNAQFYR